MVNDNYSCFKYKKKKLVKILTEKNMIFEKKKVDLFILILLFSRLETRFFSKFAASEH